MYIHVHIQGVYTVRVYVHVILVVPASLSMLLGCAHLHVNALPFARPFGNCAEFLLDRVYQKYLIPVVVS